LAWLFQNQRDRAARRALRRCVASIPLLVAAFAFLLQSFAAQASGWTPLEPDAPAWLLSALCHSDDPAAANPGIDQAGQAPQRPAQPGHGHAHPICPACVAMHHGWTVVDSPAAALSAPRQVGVASFLLREPGADPLPLRRRQALSRAPPVNA
jgi:hypothetical protein